MCPQSNLGVALPEPSSTTTSTIYPVSEISKYVESLEDTCICEFIGARGTGSGHQKAYKAVTDYAARHFDNTHLLIGCKDDNDEGEEDLAGHAYRRALIRMMRKAGMNHGKEEKVRKGPVVRSTLGLGEFKHVYNGKTIFLCNFIRDQAIGDSSGCNIYRGAVLFAQGKNEETKKCLQDFIKTCLDWQHEQRFTHDIKDNKFRLFRLVVSCGQGIWDSQGVKNARDASTVILRQNLKEEILGDFEDFCSKETAEWYKTHGIPRRRSYLFYGEPGSGKTSLIKVLAGKYKLNACFLSLGHDKINNQIIAGAISTMPPGSLLVLEDVDSLFDKDRNSKDKVEVTFSGILNMLDGIISGSDGRLTIMTTNHLDKIDASLIRCGRVDRIFDISTPDAQQISTYFGKFYPQSSQQTRDQFADEIMKLEQPAKKSMATLQGFFTYVRKDSAEKAATRVAEFYERYFDAQLPNANAALPN
eukprot:Plantae.Rhodophyta-Hildenbrandia_rubra.ctg1349.p1 GENE.Plantae.Rhodophyta-Hildenbrandia_rubra.ctg1349~~Plantae.Rhodophyta-Hildenbrandia_rubra.ctg1349.p1  ORF type:complete len:473 (-),score=57.51 Plantae.Rhodophyta-Hildenbrandia_rubra.ctg1349:1558-2976(-)